MPKLTHLRLPTNKLKTLSPGFFCGSNIMTLELANNQLATLPANVFYHLPRPLVLSLGYNPLQCNVELCWLKNEDISKSISWFASIQPDCADGTNWNTWTCDDSGNISYSVSLS